MDKQFVVNFVTKNHRDEFCCHYRYVEAINQRQALAKVKRELPTEFIGGGRFDSFTKIEELQRSCC